MSFVSMTIAAGQVTPEQRKATRDRMARWSRPVLGLALPVGLAVVWEIIVRLGFSDGRLVPPPSRIYQEFAELAQSGELLRHVIATLLRVTAGFGFGTVAGTLLGAIAGYSALVRRVIDPTLQGLRAVPSIAWIPLFILWLGIFETSKVALIAVGVFFPIYLGVMGAVLSVDRLANRLGSLPQFSRSRFSARSPMPSLSWPARRSCAGRTRSGRRARTDMLSLERVGKTYPNGVHALDAITLGVVPGEIVVVI